MIKLYKWLTIYPSLLFGCFQIPFLKKASIFFLAVILLLSGMQAAAQANGDFQTKNTTGNWSNYLSWNIRTGGIWIAAVAGELPTTTSSVYIQSGHTISVDNITAVCNDLNFTAMGTTLKVFLLFSP